MNIILGDIYGRLFNRHFHFYTIPVFQKITISVIFTRMPLVVLMYSCEWLVTVPKKNHFRQFSITVFDVFSITFFPGQLDEKKGKKKKKMEILRFFVSSKFK